MERPISGTLIKLEWLKDELYKNIKNCISAEEIKQIVAWYFSYGAYLEFKKEVLLESIKDKEELFFIAESLNEEDIKSGKKPPVFRKGDIVEVIVNAKNLTYHKGVIHEAIYHYKDKDWNYYIMENNKKISKRYCKDDLRLIDKRNQNC